MIASIALGWCVLPVQRPAERGAMSRRLGVCGLLTIASWVGAVAVVYGTNSDGGAIILGFVPILLVSMSGDFLATLLTGASTAARSDPSLPGAVAVLAAVPLAVVSFALTSPDVFFLGRLLFAAVGTTFSVTLATPLAASLGRVIAAKRAR